MPNWNSKSQNFTSSWSYIFSQSLLCKMSGFWSADSMSSLNLVVIFLFGAQTQLVSFSSYGIFRTNSDRFFHFILNLPSWNFDIIFMAELKIRSDLSSINNEFTWELKFLSKPFVCVSFEWNHSWNRLSNSKKGTKMMLAYWS